VYKTQVTACKPCNHNKGHKLIKPLREPYKPDYYALVGQWRDRLITVRDPRWYQYLGIERPEGA
jgi:hypothetical protein